MKTMAIEFCRNAMFGARGLRFLTMVVLWGVGVCALATNVFVVTPGTLTSEWPYTNWSMAATNIQDALDAINTNNGNIVFVSNGTYYLTNQIVVTNAVVLRSWNVAGVAERMATILDGNNYVDKPVTNRCLYLDNANAMVDGFTMRGGVVGDLHIGGGVLMYGGTLTNCIVSNNQSSIYAWWGGGIVMYADQSKITHCLIISNAASLGGGLGLRGSGVGVVEHCEIIGNKANHTSNWNGGGGIYMNDAPNTVVRDCTIANNTAVACGGGVNIMTSGGVENCRIVSNVQTSAGSSRDGSGVHIYGSNAWVRNCLIAYNTNVSSKAAVVSPGYTGGGKIENCTIVNNMKYGLYVFDAYATGNKMVLVNTIICSNVLSDVLSTNYVVCSNCMSSVELPGKDNTTNAPVFQGGGFRPAADSPGINAGLNQAWMAGAVDLSGSRRVDRFSYVVDMGCYEYLPKGMLITGNGR
ncbi:MAG: right-handed parallel beta-helix repeat-containing protein [Kiritimatiellae bacterium]|nr:right-handed parallel beta-helix repeat-containing protein [Kiritimatiellia bacterium]